jgi:uncharacterized protein (DUF433 family)
MKFKDNNVPTVVWRECYARHKDIASKAPRLKAWRRLSADDRHPNGGMAKDVSRYPEAVLKSFEDALKRCPTISIHQDIMDGQPCISETRIPVRAVLRTLEQYGSIDAVRTCYPHLTKDQVEDALYFSQIVLELPGDLEDPATTP